MIGLGTIINTAAIIIGGLGGMLFGKKIPARLQDTIMKANGICVIFIGIAGIVLATVIFVTSFLFLLKEYGSLEGILRAGSEMLGIDFEKEFGSLFQ